MKKKNPLTKALAIAGTVLVWLPILAPFLFSLAAFLLDHRFRFDYLMPAELFLFDLIGGILLFWAAVRANAHRKLIGWSLVLAVVLLVGSQGLAVITGLASGAVEPTGWRIAPVAGMLAGSALSVIAAGVGGIRLLRDLFKPRQPAPEA